MKTQGPKKRLKQRLKRACQIFLELAFVAGIVVGLFFTVLIVHADTGVSLYDEASAHTVQASQEHALPTAIGLLPLPAPRLGFVVVSDPSPTLSLPSPSGGRAPPAD